MPVVVRKEENEICLCIHAQRAVWICVNPKFLNLECDSVSRCCSLLNLEWSGLVECVCVLTAKKTYYNQQRQRLLLPERHSASQSLVTQYVTYRYSLSVCIVTVIFPNCTSFIFIRSLVASTQVTCKKCKYCKFFSEKSINSFTHKSFFLLHIMHIHPSTCNNNNAHTLTYR